jgi:hypothetical protein
MQTSRTPRQHSSMIPDPTSLLAGRMVKISWKQQLAWISTFVEMTLVGMRRLMFGSEGRCLSYGVGGMSLAVC